MKPGIYQRIDGTVYWLHEDGRWQYLSPLFGEWLEVFDQPDNGELSRYPKNLDAAADQKDGGGELERLRMKIGLLRSFAVVLKANHIDPNSPAHRIAEEIINRLK
jgi:hypothetical protein